MSLVLGIESSTHNCSVALFKGQEILALREESANRYLHSEKLHLFIEEVLVVAQVSPSDLNAIALGKGPGSYTGLRIGVAAAKGLAYALDIPVIAVNGLELLARAFLLNNTELAENARIFPMLDARRMEVYTQAFSRDLKALSSVKALVVDEESFPAEEGPYYFIGDGAEKLKEFFPGKEYHFSGPKYPSSTQMGTLIKEALDNEDFVDLAYFEPFYLKEFVATKSKRLI